MYHENTYKWKKWHSQLTYFQVSLRQTNVFLVYSRHLCFQSVTYNLTKSATCTVAAVAQSDFPKGSMSSPLEKMPVRVERPFWMLFVNWRVKGKWMFQISLLANKIELDLKHYLSIYCLFFKSWERNTYWIKLSEWNKWIQEWMMISSHGWPCWAIVEIYGSILNFRNRRNCRCYSVSVERPCNLWSLKQFL